MVRSTPNSSSRASPSTCADECQKVSRPSASANDSSCSAQSPSSGRNASQIFAPSSFATTTFFASALLICAATSRGVVTPLMPSFTDPSGRTILMGTAAWRAASTAACWRAWNCSNSSMRRA